jgi:hypothetical protein
MNTLGKLRSLKNKKEPLRDGKGPSLVYKTIFGNFDGSKYFEKPFE